MQHFIHKHLVSSSKILFDPRNQGTGCFKVTVYLLHNTIECMWINKTLSK